MRGWRFFTADNEEALASIVIKRRFQYCMEIQYDDKLIDYTITPAFLAFNQANKLVKEILEKGPPMVSSIQLVIKVSGTHLANEVSLYIRNLININN